MMAARVCSLMRERESCSSSEGVASTGSPSPESALNGEERGIIQMNIRVPHLPCFCTVDTVIWTGVEVMFRMAFSAMWTRYSNHNVM